jgi:hypothetical protein
MTSNSTTTGTTTALDTTGTSTGAIGDKATQAYGAARDAVAPMTDKARGFAKQRPFATAALAGVVGLALLNTLRGKR